MAGAAGTSEYAILQTFNYNLFRFILSIFHMHGTAVHASSGDIKKELDTLWRTQLSTFIMLLLELLHLPVLTIGTIMESYLNFVDANGGLSNIVYLLLTGLGSGLVWPKGGTDKYFSVIAHLDWRTQLDKSLATPAGGKQIDPINVSLLPEKSVPNSRVMADLCTMSSKLAYENAEVIKAVVTKTWNMNFIGQYECWNDAQRLNATGLFIATDRAQNANVILVAFRGTQPFNTSNWISDFDFSWFDVQGVGRVHIGFLEALGLGNRNNLETFSEMQRRLLEPGASRGPTISGLPANITSTKLLACDAATNTLEELVKKHKDAKIYITGHSLGGALACLFSGLIYYMKEKELSDKLEAVYTYGQPRVGDQNFVKYYNAHLTQPVNKYFRVVYNNDFVPRIPFDDPISGFKHAGLCRYFDSFYNGQILPEEPNKNYFSPLFYLPTAVTAVWELIFNTLISPYLHGDDYFETKTSTMFRLLGILLPGLACHSPVNYVNSVRIGTFKESVES